MSDPIGFIIRIRVKEGLLDDFIEHYQSSIPPDEAGRPGTLVQLAYVSEDGTEVTIVRIFSDADAMDLHLEGAGARSKKAYEFIEPDSIEVLGTPNSSTIETMKKIAGSGVALKVDPRFIGGFVR